MDFYSVAYTLLIYARLRSYYRILIDTILCIIARWRTITGSNNNIAISMNGVVVPNQKKFIYHATNTTYQSTMGDSIFSVEFNVAAKPEILITSLLLQTVTSFQSLSDHRTFAEPLNKNDVSLIQLLLTAQYFFSQFLYVVGRRRRRLRFLLRYTLYDGC